MPNPHEQLREGLRYEKAGALARALDCYAAVLEAAREPALRAETLRRRSHTLRAQCSWDEAIEAARESASVAAAAGLADAEAEALNAEAAVYQSRGQFDAATALYERMLQLSRLPRIRGVALQNLGSIAALKGDTADAERRFLASATCFRESGYRPGEATALNNYGRAAFDAGNLDVAAHALDKAVTLARQLEDLDLAALASLNRAEVLVARDDLEQAKIDVTAALGHFGQEGNRWRELECRRLLGDVARREGDREAARRLYATGLRAAEELEAQVEAEQLRERLRALEAE